MPLGARLAMAFRVQMALAAVAAVRVQAMVVMVVMVLSSSDGFQAVAAQPTIRPAHL